MTTFERYFISDPKAHVEGRNPYYHLRGTGIYQKILAEFVLDPEVGHVINGHTPVKKGTDPIMANNKMIVIDGGFSKPYQNHRDRRFTRFWIIPMVCN